MSPTTLDKSEGKVPDQEKIAELRRDYVREALDEESIAEHPIDQFMIWFEQALSAKLMDANAMTLATSTKDGKPSARIVLLKGVDKNGFRFYTNYGSRKGRELSENPHAAVCFYWSPLERQVRIEGNVEKLSREESAAYFQRRPRMSQISAWVSKQSSEVSSRNELEKRYNELSAQFSDEKVPLPDFWGGYLLIPKKIEFWQGRKGRMHDRICYSKTVNDSWSSSRLAP